MILGSEVRLRAIERDDIPAFLRWLNDPEVKHFLLWHKPLSAAMEEQWFEAQLKSRNSMVLGIETNAGVHIGNIGLDDIDWKSRHAELGIVIGEKAYWGRGYGSDAIRALLRYAFGELNLHAVHLRVYDYNERGMRAYAKCGFKHEGRLRDRIYRDGEYHDILLMSILRQEYDGLEPTWPRPAACAHEE
jgi:diamine N-acetyltransferase